MGTIIVGCDSHRHAQLISAVIVVHFSGHASAVASTIQAVDIETDLTIASHSISVITLHDPSIETEMEASIRRTLFETFDVNVYDRGEYQYVPS